MDETSSKPTGAFAIGFGESSDEMALLFVLAETEEIAFMHLNRDLATELVYVIAHYLDETSSDA